MIERLNEALGDRYRVESRLGEGGMATVFLADDLKHDRKVAIKVLKPELAAVIGGERFVAEIKTTAALQHPHILPLFDSGAAEGFLYYVMPYVEGESLRERLDNEKQLSVDESVKIASSVASALHYAHEQGIVHRDIKPANILLHAGEPVVADFGIALAISAAGGGRLTETGMSVGTPHYMSPEQASADRDVSARSDIYALACVLYEMLTGDPPHTGPTAQVVLMRILTEDPRLVSDVRKSVPAHVQAALVRALEKLPADRFETADDFKRALADPGYRYDAATVVRPAARRAEAGTGWSRDNRTRVLAGAGLLAVAALGWTALANRAPEAAPLPVYRYQIADSTRTGVELAISPTGDVAYTGENGLRLRRATDLETRDIPNTEGGSQPVFSPDGEWLAFVVSDPNRQLVKLQLATGTRVTLVSDPDIPQITGPTWAEDGMIYFATGSAVRRVSEVGGVPETLFEVDGFAFRPVLLPGGEAVLYTEVGGAAASARVVARRLADGDTTVVAAPGGGAVWSPSGHVLHGHTSATLFAVPFDPVKLEVTGPPVPVQEGVRSFGAISFFALSSGGDLAYVGGDADAFDLQSRIFAWVDADGDVEPLPIAPTDHDDAAVSPDGRQVAYTRGGDIWLFDLERGTNQRFTFEGEDHHDPIWTPDGRAVAFSGIREGGAGSQDMDIYIKDVDGRSPARRVVGLEGEEYAQAWRGDSLVFTSRAGAGAPYDIHLVVLDDDAEPVPLLRADWTESSPRISPDGRWMAYVSDETGEPHVFVREFPGMGGRWQVSAEPVRQGLEWSPTGDALYFIPGEDASLRRAELSVEPTFTVTATTTVAEGPVGLSMRGVGPGGRVLVTRPEGAEALDPSGAESMIVVANWRSELLRRLGVPGGWPR